MPTTHLLDTSNTILTASFMIFRVLWIPQYFLLHIFYSFTHPWIVLSFPLNKLHVIFEFGFTFIWPSLVWQLLPFLSNSCVELVLFIVILITVIPYSSFSIMYSPVSYNIICKVNQSKIFTRWMNKTIINIPCDILLLIIPLLIKTTLMKNVWESKNEAVCFHTIF